ncbi:MAG: hypothetical protein SCH71_14700, partial [Desulfobulbaceae bacterium]|nr:hypothetical protein [Desulfobulbaceae bacterium]
MGRVLNRETSLQGADVVTEMEGNILHTAMARYAGILRGLRPRARTEHLSREPGDPVTVYGYGCHRPHCEVQGRTAMMYGCRKSDISIVPEKSPNKSCSMRDTE